MQLLDGMIATQRLSEFVEQVIELYNEEKKDQMLWDIWLYRVHDKSYADFVASVDGTSRAKPTDEETANIITESRGILEGFKAAPQKAE